MLEHGWGVSHQMLSEPDGAPLGLADQLGEPPVALDHRQVALPQRPLTATSTSTSEGTAYGHRHQAAGLDVAACFDGLSHLPVMFLSRATNCYLVHG
jgi:hypothetical protein